MTHGPCIHTVEGRTCGAPGVINLTTQIGDTSVTFALCAEHAAPIWMPLGGMSIGFAPPPAAQRAPRVCVFCAGGNHHACSGSPINRCGCDCGEALVW